MTLTEKLKNITYNALYEKDEKAKLLKVEDEQKRAQHIIDNIHDKACYAAHHGLTDVSIMGLSRYEYSRGKNIVIADGIEGLAARHVWDYCVTNNLKPTLAYDVMSGDVDIVIHW